MSRLRNNNKQWNMVQRENEGVKCNPLNQYIKYPFLVIQQKLHLLLYQLRNGFHFLKTTIFLHQNVIGSCFQLISRFYFTQNLFYCFELSTKVFCEISIANFNMNSPASFFINFLRDYKKKI